MNPGTDGVIQRRARARDNEGIIPVLARAVREVEQAAEGVALCTLLAASEALLSRHGPAPIPMATPAV